MQSWQAALHAQSHTHFAPHLLLMQDDGVDPGMKDTRCHIGSHGYMHPQGQAGGAPINVAGHSTCQLATNGAAWPCGPRKAARAAGGGGSDTHEVVLGERHGKSTHAALARGAQPRSGQQTVNLMHGGLKSASTSKLLSTCTTIHNLMAVAHQLQTLQA